MITASEQFNSIMEKSSRTFCARFLLDGAEVSCDIKKIILNRGACGSETFSPGGVFLSYIEATVDELEESLENRELLLQIGLTLDDGAVEYIDMGYYTVTKPKSTAYQTVFTAVGRITSKLNCLFVTGDMSLSGIAAAITSITGVPIVFNGLMAAGTVEADMTGLTCREALEVIASVLGGFATEDNAGNIVISRFSAADPIPYNGERMTELSAFNDYDYSITGVKVITAEAGEDEDGNEIPEVAYSAGAPRLIIANLYMTESLFGAFAENLMGYSYRPGTVPLALGDPRIDPWDCLSVTDVKGNVFVVPCLSIVHTFDGGISTMITAPGDSETEGQTQTAGPITKMIERINADLFTAQQAIIKRLKADEADLTYARITDLDAVNATIEGLIVGELTAGSMQAVTGYVDRLTANKADIDFANVDAAKIKQAWINDLLVQGSILTKDINAATGSFSQYLTGVNIVGDIITAGTIATDRLLIRDPDTNEGILFAINNGIVSQEGLTQEALKRLTLNGQVITAESITADKIHVTDLSAFGATIGGFNITEDSLYSGVKESVGNTTRGIYIDTDGQIAFGDASSFVKYYKAEDGTYKLDISATNINFGFGGEGGGIRPREEESGETVIVIENNTTIEGDTTIIGGTSIEGDTSISGSTSLVDEDTSFTIKSDGVTIEGANINITGKLLLNPALSIENGGTGATTAAEALKNLGAASTVAVSALNNRVLDLEKNKYVHPTYTDRTGVPTANATLSHGGTFTVTQPVCDATGHITAMNTRTYTLPADNNTDTKVTNTKNQFVKAYITGTTSGSTNTGTQVFDTEIYIDSEAGRLVTSDISSNSITVRNDGTLYANSIQINTGAYLQLLEEYGYGVLVQNGSGNYNAYFRPNDANTITCGTSSYPWYRVYGSLGYSTTSDAREKSDIIPIADLPSMYSRGVSGGNVMEQLFDKLIPSVYHVNTDVDNKLHIGFIAQDIVAAMEDIGMTEDDLGLVIHEYWTDEDTGEEKDKYSLVYEELTSLNTYMIQKMQNQISQLEERITVMENK